MKTVSDRCSPPIFIFFSLDSLAWMLTLHTSKSHTNAELGAAWSICYTRNWRIVLASSRPSRENPNVAEMTPQLFITVRRDADADDDGGENKTDDKKGAVLLLPGTTNDLVKYPCNSHDRRLALQISRDRCSITNGKKSEHPSIFPSYL